MKELIASAGIMFAVLFSFYMGWEEGRRNKYEYQIRLEIDSAYVYSNGRYVGACAHGKDGVDSVFLIDNY